jgi:DNA-binding beta-propeller fold protein YncE
MKTNPIALDADESVVGPIDVAISPDGLFARVVNRSDGTITPLDLTDPLVPVASEPVVVGTAPVGILISPTGSFDWVELE